MNEWTEQEEQQIIERAKTGDPEANYALSLWALERGEEEPDEPRWNRLAAKCLVKAAQAGYGPAKEQMAALLKQSGQEEQPPVRKSQPPAEPAPVRPIRRPAQEEYEDQAPEDDGTDDSDVKVAQPARRSAPVRPTSTVRRPAPRRRVPEEPEEDGFDADEDEWDDEEEEEAPRGRGRGRGLARPARPARPARDDERGGGSRWTDDKWRRMEFICVAVCAVLLVIIAVLLLTNRHGGEGNNNSSIPAAGLVGGDGGGATVSDYPDEATKSAIMAAGLDIQPAAEDYVHEQTLGTVSVSSEYLRVRKGPNTTYDPVDQLVNGATVSILAQKNEWDLISYQGENGTAYGWCNGGYVIITAGTAAGATAPTDNANVEG